MRSTPSQPSCWTHVPLFVKAIDGNGLGRRLKQVATAPRERGPMSKKIKDAKGMVDTKMLRSKYEEMMETTINAATLVKSMRNRGFQKKQIRLENGARGYAFTGLRLRDDA